MFFLRKDSFKQFVCVKWGKQTGDKCGEREHVHTLPKFQNEEPLSSLRSVKKETLYV